MITIVKPQTKEELEGVAKVNYLVDSEAMSPFWTEEAVLAHKAHGRQEALAAAESFSEHILAAKDGDLVVGMIVCCPAYANFEGEILIPNSALVNNVYVLPQYRGRGIGWQLLDAACEQLQDYSAITLYVYEDNKKAKAFYQHYGFQMDGVSYLDGETYRGRFERMILRARPGN